MRPGRLKYQRPQVYRDDPKFISPIILALRDIAYLFMIGSPVALLLCAVLVPTCVTTSIRQKRLRPRSATFQLATPLLTWLSLFFILGRNLFASEYVLAWIPMEADPTNKLAERINTPAFVAC